MPHINQMNPQGASRSYRGGPNCAPSVVAMLARGHGKMPAMSDAGLIEHLSRGLVTADGTKPQDLARMLARAGVPHGGKALGCCYEESELRDQLQRGNTLIAQVRSFDPGTRTDSAHYVLIRGMTREGNYVISDPLANRPYTVTPQQLKEAVRRAPPDGGMLIPIPKPGASGESAAPTCTDKAAAQPRSEAEALDSMCDVLRAPEPNAFMCQGDAFNPRAAPSSGLANSTARYFAAVRESRYEDLSMRVVSKDAQVMDEMVMQWNEKQNLVALDIVYSTTASTVSQVNPPVTPADLSAEAYASQLLQRKQARDQSVDDTLQKLEASVFEKDQQVLAVIKAEELKQPGIGRKSNTVAF